MTDLCDMSEYSDKLWELAHKRGIAEGRAEVLEQMRAEIEKVFCMSVVTNELRTPMEVKTEILQIIDKYR